MLVLSRREGETILIGDSTVLTILEINGSTVRVGFEADREVGILRGELAGEERDSPELVEA